ncbi:hypothetical protein CsSME_00044037 [Camellia sinensis var. sinensis]
MGTAAAQCPIHGNSRVLHPKVDFSSFNFSANGEISRLNLYPSSASSGTSKLPNASSGRQQVRKSVGDHDSQDDELLGSPVQVLHED